MKGKVCLVMLFMMMNSYIGSAQQPMNDYSYIQVPEIYEFLKGKDQYQLNSLTKFLFNKYGFNAYFENELPNVRKCDGLYAVVEGKPGFIYTRITVIVKDCNGVELYRSPEGKSKLKDFKKAYHEALRRAFDSFERLKVQQKEINLEASSTVSSTTSNIIYSTKATMPTAKFSSYRHGEGSYLLRKTATGYSLLQEVTGAEDDLLLVGRVSIEKEGLKFTNVMGSVYDAFFDSEKNLSLKIPTGVKKYILIKN